MKNRVLIALMVGACMVSPKAHAFDWFDKVVDVLESETSGSSSSSSSVSGLSSSEISTGLRDALRIGTQQVVAQLGVRDGFNLDPKAHISLPGALGRVDRALSSIGMGGLTEDLELRLNRAAEVATPKAKALFLKAIQEMTITDAKNILTGPDDAATSYLRKTMGGDLEKEMQPIIKNALASAGAVQAYDSVMGQYAQIPFMPDVKANLNGYVTDKAMDGIFYYVAQEEAAIRKDPVKRTTDILKKVFAAQ